MSEPVQEKFLSKQTAYSCSLHFGITPPVRVYYGNTIQYRMTRNVMSVKEEFCTNGLADLILVVILLHIGNVMTSQCLVDVPQK